MAGRTANQLERRPPAAPRVPADPPPAAEPSADLLPGEAVAGNGRDRSDDPSDDFAAAHGEPLGRTLDLDTWTEGPDFAGFYGRLREEVAQAVRFEKGWQAEYRRTVFPHLRFRDAAPPDAGVWRTTPARLAEVHRRTLFNGGVEAGVGTTAGCDTIPITVTQIGVCLVSYQGNEGTWGHRLFRRDLRERAGDPIDEAIEVLERRRGRGGGLGGDRLSRLARQGIVAYATRAALLDRSDAPWRMGRGDPCPFGLLTGSGMAELLRRGLDLMRRLVAFRKFVFVQGEPAERWLVTLGHALRPLEYAVVEDQTQKFRRIAGGHYRGEWGGGMKDAVDAFVESCGPQVVCGLCRASRFAPARMFYAHRDHAHAAALVALADGALQEHRGSPLLLDLADGLCAATYGGAAFAAAARMAYADADEPFRYLPESLSRR